MRLLPLLGLSLFSGAFVAAVHAQTPKTAKIPIAPKPPVAPAATEEGAVIVRGRESLTDTQTEISRLTGDVSVTQIGENFILHAQSLIFNKPQNRAIATQKLSVQTTDSTIRGERIDADFNTKILTMTGSVVINTHGKGDGITGNPQGGVRAEFASKPSRLTCDQVDWDYETRQAILTGHIHMTQGKNSGTCDRIEFDERQNVARLRGHVIFTDDKGQSYATPDLTIYNDENRIVTGMSSIRFKPNAVAATRAPKPLVPVKKAPVITAEEANAFGIKRAPVPAFQPEPTPTPEPEPAPEAPDDATPAENAAR